MPFRNMNLTRLVVLPLTAWTIVLGVSLASNLRARDDFVQELAVERAAAFFDYDVVIRRWASGHGGVYVPVTEETPPNPYLGHVPQRDLSVDGGPDLTLLNPAYIIRQLNELAVSDDRIQGKITSRRPLRPENAPDAWEAGALDRLASGETEVSELLETEQGPVLRFMRAFATQQHCLKCHGHQGYEIGDQRGGVGVQVPMRPMHEAAAGSKAALWRWHLGIWALGVVGILFGHRTVARMLRHQQEVSDELRESARSTESLIDSVPFGIMIVGPDRRVLKVNQWACKILGRDEKAIVGEVCHHNVCPTEEDRCPVYDLGEMIDDTERRALRPDGSEVPILKTVLPFRWQSRDVQLEAFVDVSQQKQQEIDLITARDTADHANRAKSEFLANMSHEIRTPLNGVVGMTELLLGGELDEEQRECAEVIETSAEILLTVINDILDFSKIEAGRLDLETIRFDLRDQVQRVERALRPVAASKDLEFGAEFTSDVPRFVEGDPTRLRQILTNLVNNAAKFTKEGSVAIRIGVAEGSSDPGRLRFEVVDTGIGIDPERRDKLFDAFVQADSSTTRRYGGTGLGLSISKQLVDLMHGTIGVESEVGRGSCFWFEIPFVIDEPGHDEPEHDEVLDSGVPATDLDVELSSGSIRVLVAEDNPVNQKVISAMLTRLGAEVVIVEDGLQAVDTWREASFDLILMDWQMPRLDGLAAIEIIRAEESAEGRPRTAIVSVTANAMAGDRERCAASGADGWLAKPVRRSELVEALERFARRPAGDRVHHQL